MTQETQTRSVFRHWIRDDQVAVMELDVPDQSMNTLHTDDLDSFNSILDQLEQNADVKGVVLISGKPNNFMAGVDIKMFDTCETAADLQRLAETGQQLFGRVENYRVPIVAAIHGFCLGGGLELSLACRFRICSDSDKTQLGLPEVKLGLLPGSGGTQRLPRQVGLMKALDMILTGKTVRAKQARKIGLVDEVVPQSILLESAAELALNGKPSRPNKPLVNRLMEDNSLGQKVILKQAAKTVDKKTLGNYPAPGYILEVIEAGLNDPVKGYALEAERFGELGFTSESVALRSLFFASTEMKQENKEHAVEVNRVAVLGGGLMGGGIAYVTSTRAGLPVRLKDISPDGLKHALEYSYKLLGKNVKRRFIRRSQMQQQMARITPTLHYDGMSQTDLVVEAVFEDLNLKQQMVAEIEQHAAEHCIFATNTSSIPIHQIAEKAARPEQVIGLHYFSPVDKMPLAEVIVHDKTSQATIDTTVAFARRQGKTPIVVRDVSGFYVNRILAPYMNEACRCLSEGEPIEHIDKALKKFGFPVGPINLLDEVGIDIGAKVGPILTAELGARFQLPPAMDKLIADKRCGRKNGKGFYLYKGGKRGKPDSTIYPLLGCEPNSSLSGAVIAERCVLLLLNEAVRCLDEGVIKSPRDGDIGAIFGIGFPPFLGGPFRYMDQLGLGVVVEKLNYNAGRYGEQFTPCERLLQMAEADQRFYPD